MKHQEASNAMYWMFRFVAIHMASASGEEKEKKKVKTKNKRGDSGGVQSPKDGTRS